VRRAGDAVRRSNAGTAMRRGHPLAPDVERAASAPVAPWVLFAALFGVFLIWSNSFHAIAYFRRALDLDTATAVALRYGPVFPLCLAYCLVRWRDTRSLLAHHAPRVILMGLCMVPLYNLPLMWGQGRVPPATASLLIAMTPVFALLLALAFLGERARLTKLCGMGLAFTGVILLVRSQQALFGPGYVPHAAVVLIAPLSWAAATTIGKALTRHSDPLLVTFTATAIGSLPFALYLGSGGGASYAVIAALTPTGWAAWIHLALLCTIVGFGVWFWTLRYLPASTVAAFIYLNPPLTAAFGFVWGTENFRWATVLYGAVTLAGVALSAGLWTRRPPTAGGRPVTR